MVDSTADSIKSVRSTAEDVREDFEELQAPGPGAPFAATPLTSMPFVATDKDGVRPTSGSWLCGPGVQSLLRCFEIGCIC